MIITLYVNTIRALQILDPRGVLLEQVSPPFRSYLRSRTDTVRCVVKALTNDSGEGSELFDELRLGVHENATQKEQSRRRMLDMTEYSSDDEDEADEEADFEVGSKKYGGAFEMKAGYPEAEESKA